MTKSQIGLLLLVSGAAIALSGRSVVVAAPTPQQPQQHAPQHVQRPPEPSAAAVSELVAEVRALRADFAESARRSLRSQLLLGRLQMQEQRLTYLDRQRSEVSASLMQQTTMTAGIASQVRSIGNCDAAVDAKLRRECELMAENFKRQLSVQQKAEEQLRAREAELLNTVATEQALWSDFNARLDELERALAQR